MGETARKPDTLADIIVDWLVWLGKPVTAICKECGRGFTGPERSNGVLCKVCPDCWYKPMKQTP